MRPCLLTHLVFEFVGWLEAVFLLLFYESKFYQHNESIIIINAAKAKVYFFYYISLEIFNFDCCIGPKSGCKNLDLKL